MKEHLPARKSRERPGRAGAARAPENRQRDALEQPVARLLGQPGARKQLEHYHEIAQPAAALRLAKPLPPAHAAFAERVAFRRGREQRQRLVETIGVVEAAPGDLGVAREALGWPLGPLVSEGVVERGAADPGIVETRRGRP